MTNRKKDAQLGYERLKQEKERMLNQKHENVKGLIDTIKNKPKFIKLLEYSLNSIDLMITPPNRDLRINSKVIIEEEGVEGLKLVALQNLENDEILTKICIILTKLLGEPVDKELAKDFIEKAGHELIFEMVLSKQPSLNSIHLIKIMNSLVSIPQLTQKLIDSGIVEAVKLVNDLYYDYPEIQEINLETIKKLTNLKKGREIFLKKNLLPNVLKTTEKAATDKNENCVLLGMNIIDNVTRNEEGIEELKKKNQMDKITKILDVMDTNEEILQIGAKIYSKVSTKEDFVNEVEKVLSTSREDLQESSKVEELKKSLVLISNLMLIEDNITYLKDKERIRGLKNLFTILKQIDFTDKDSAYTKGVTLATKFLMKIFARLVNSLDSNELSDMADDEFITAILEALKSS